MPNPFSARPAAARAIEPSSSFWLAMYAASALGTNLGDFWAEGLSFGLIGSFFTLIVVSVALIGGDRLYGPRTEAFYWLAIVILRAAATNVGDLIAHRLGLGYVAPAILLGAATLAAGWFTIAGGPANASPRINLRYWGAMIIGGVFGTIAGDLVAHVIGLPLAAVALLAVMVATIAARTRVAPASMLGYWAIVLAERAAGTPAGDYFAEGRGLGLGLSIAMAITGAALLLALGLRGARRKVPLLARA